jgi:hypothetical protein
MPSTKVVPNRRRQSRTQAVLPVRVRGRDDSGALFEELAHTLDVTSTGVRLGAIRHKLQELDTLVVLYRQRRIEFTIVWSKPLEGTHEYHVGLQTAVQQNVQQNDPWGLSLSNSVQPANQVSAASGAA